MAILTFVGPCIVNIFLYIYPTRCNFTQFIYIWKLLYMFRVVPPPIIRSAYNCTYSIWYLSHRYCYLPLLWRSWNSSNSTIEAGSSNGVTNTDAVNTGICAPDEGWRYHPKHVGQFPDIICVALHLVGYIYDAQTHER